jgi:hypothetical protein
MDCVFYAIIFLHEDHARGGGDWSQEAKDIRYSQPWKDTRANRYNNKKEGGGGRSSNMTYDWKTPRKFTAHSVI